MRTLSLLLATATICTAAVTRPDQIKVPAGFKVELLREADPGEGSWINMAQDDRGRLYLASQAGSFARDGEWGGIWRVTLKNETTKDAKESGVRSQESGGSKPTIGAQPGEILNLKSQILNWERVAVPVGDAMGMLWAFDSLYVSGMGPQGRGIYRCKDTDGDDQLDTATLFKAIPGGAGEHGAHAIILGPDKKLYIVNGNSTGILDGLDPDSPYRHWGEDDLLPRLKDPVATFFDKLKAPYGCVYRTDADGTKWELFAGGFRNPYDIAFNPDGELFTYDSDMEWDRGLPWYRPTRILHVVPGGEYGFREGSAKWPAYFPDSLPAVADIGVGCPTGMKFGTGAKGWPEKYRRALFLHDWTYGRILAVTLHEKGASYTARNDLASYTYPRDAEANGDVEVFLSGKGMPVTDLEFLRDGSMVFTVGGRGTAAALYRVSWMGEAARRADLERQIAKIEAEVKQGVDDLQKKLPNAAPARQWTDDEINAELARLRAKIREMDERFAELSPKADYAPKAQRKSAGGTASEASATTGSPSAKASAPAGAQENGIARAYRRSLEGDGSTMPDAAGLLRINEQARAIEENDRFTYFAARRVAENLPQDKLLALALEDPRFYHSEKHDGLLRPEDYGKADTRIQMKNAERAAALDGLMGLLALARAGDSSTQIKLLNALGKYSLASLDADLKLLHLRILELSFARQGRPSEERVKAVMEELLAHYPVPPIPANAAAGGAGAPRTLPKADDSTPAPRTRDGAHVPPPPAERAAERPFHPGAPVDAPAWRLNRELCALLTWLSNPELGALNADLAKADGAAKPGEPAKAPAPAAAKGKTGDFRLYFDKSRFSNGLAASKSLSLGQSSLIVGQSGPIAGQSELIAGAPGLVAEASEPIPGQPALIAGQPGLIPVQSSSLAGPSEPLPAQSGPVDAASGAIAAQSVPLPSPLDAFPSDTSPLLAQAAPVAGKSDALPTEAPPVPGGGEVKGDKSKVIGGAQPAAHLSPITDHLSPAPNPGADIFPGRKGAAFHAELGRQVIEKTLAHMDAAPSQEEQIWYALCLRWAHGWTPELRVRYFRWFHEKAARYSGGNSFAKFVEAIRADAASRVPESERAALADWLRPVASPVPAVALKPRAFVKAWTLPELEAALDKLKDRQPDLARGKDLYTQAQCAQCHLFRDAGGNVGPDLTAVAQRFGRHDILESITDPSKVVSEQYAMVTLTVLDGKGGTAELSGLVKEESSATITLLTDPLAGTTKNLYKNVVVKREKAAVSTMPPGLLYTLTAEEVADLLALFGAK